MFSWRNKKKSISLDYPVLCDRKYMFILFQRLSLNIMLNMSCPVLANSVDPDQLASEEANWSGSALFVI